MPGAWQELSTPEQIDALMRLFGNFHDGCVREIHVGTGHSVAENLSMTVDWRTTVHMLVQRQFRNPSAIELRFGELVGMNVSAPDSTSEGIIMSAAFLLRDGLLYWADNSLFQGDWRTDPECTWIAARRVWWRDASEWMGPGLRYRDDSGPA